MTCSVDDVRVWDATRRAELVRIQVPNLECRCVAITAVGDQVVTGWSDGKVRSFGPETGGLKFCVPEAHHEDVTALALVEEGACSAPGSSKPWRMLSGGKDGRVRVWKVTPSHRALLQSMKEHRGAVTDIRVCSDKTQCISASKDGACLVWCLERYVRLAALFESTMFSSAFYHPDGSQIVTSGSNAKITYWEAAAGDAIRVVSGGAAEITSLSSTKSGDHFVSGAGDTSIKLWDYDGGIYLAEGRAHSGPVSAVAVSPDQATVVSVGEEGGIFLWPLPDEVVASGED